MKPQRAFTENEKKLLREFLSYDSNEYDLMLGRFVRAFSRVESNLLALLWHFGEIMPPIAPAILGGVRTDQGMSLINRIAESKKWKKSKRDKLTYVFNQLGQINKLRNDILHYGATPYGKKWKVTNQRVAHIPKRVRERIITPKILGFATHDLYVIEQHLVFMAYGHFMQGWALTSWRRALKVAWLYKPPTPRPQKKKSQRRLPRPQRQQIASQQ